MVKNYLKEPPSLPYLVVTDETQPQGLCIIRTSWLQSNQLGKFFWPPTQNNVLIEQYLLHEPTPDLAAWKLYSLHTVYCECEKLSTAKTKLAYYRDEFSSSSDPASTEKPAKSSQKLSDAKKKKIRPRLDQPLSFKVPSVPAFLHSSKLLKTSIVPKLKYQPSPVAKSTSILTKPNYQPSPIRERVRSPFSATSPNKQSEVQDRRDVRRTPISVSPLSPIMPAGVHSSPVPSPIVSPESSNKRLSRPPSPRESDQDETNQNTPESSKNCESPLDAETCSLSKKKQGNHIRRALFVDSPSPDKQSSVKKRSDAAHKSSTQRENNEDMSKKRDRNRNTRCRFFEHSPTPAAERSSAKKRSAENRVAIPAKKTKIMSEQSPRSTYLKEILQLLKKIYTLQKKKLQHNVEIEVNSSDDEKGLPDLKELYNLPLTNENEVVAMNELLKKNSAPLEMFVAESINNLKGKGADKVMQHVFNVLLDKNITKFYTWKGVQGKKLDLQSTEIAVIVKKVLKKKIGIADITFTDFMKKFFKNKNDRVKKAAKN